MADAPDGDAGPTQPEGPPWEAAPDATTPEMDAFVVVDDDGTDPRLGSVVAERYRLDERLGEGGMAVVYRAHDEQLNRTVALKLLHDEVAAEAGLRARFEREARVLAALSHPNIVSLLDFGVDRRTPFLVMELLRGTTLADLRDQPERVAWPRAVNIVTQIVAALNYAHGEGLLHRDLKPDNVFLSELDTLGEHVQLLDFGFAKFVEPEKAGAALTKSGEVFGTPFYMAPEQLSGGEADVRTDLYAVAVIVYELLARRRPFEGELRQLLRAKLVNEAPPISEIAPDAPSSDAHDAFFAKALAREPDQRFQTGAELIAALAALPEPRARTVEPAPASREKTTRRPPIWLAAAVVAVLVFALVCVGTAALLTSGDDAPSAPPAREHPEPLETDLSFMDTDDPWVQLAPWAPAVEAARQDIEDDGEVDHAQLRDLRAHARDNPDDVLAKLLLGRVFTARGMRALAVQTYQEALEADALARHDPHVAVDLVTMHADGAGSGPSRLLEDYYGADALEVVDAALDVPGLDPRRRRRLEQLSEALAAAD